ncbi:MAG: hypothetical protein HQL91_09090 [Magnetococcales bacterium]|nr:hypothetical protein [Magnetococcales bacterium]
MNAARTPWRVRRCPMVCALGLSGLLMAAGAAWAAPPPFEQKMSLLERFLKQSATSEQVGREGSEALRASLEKTRALRDEARKLYDAGETAMAMQRIDQAIQQAARLSQSNAGPDKRSWNQQVRFEGLMAGVAAFADAYQRNLSALAAEPNRGQGSVPPPISPAEIVQRVEQAQALAGKGDLEAANTLLTDVQNQLVSALRGMLNHKTLVHELKFATPEHEYRYELERFSGLETVLNMALSRATIDENGRRFIQEQMEKSRTLHQEAERSAAGGKFQEAIGTLEKANEYLSRVMNMAGMGFP